MQPVLGIDCAKAKFDAALLIEGKYKTKVFSNDARGFGELQTCVRESIPVTAVVFNNGQWGAEKKNHVDFYKNRFVGVNLDRQPSWAAVAEAMTVWYLKDDRSIFEEGELHHGDDSDSDTASALHR